MWVVDAFAYKCYTLSLKDHFYHIVFGGGTSIWPVKIPTALFLDV